MHVRAPVIVHARSRARNEIMIIRAGFQSDETTSPMLSKERLQHAMPGDTKVSCEPRPKVEREV
eukprot:2466746-Pleurochrysis_carterae.AAC.1